MTLRAVTVLLFAIALVLNDCGQNTERELPEGETPPPPSGAREALICVNGTLSEGGVECPAMTTANGTLYTLAGPTGQFGAGDAVCVCGRPAEISICQQGRTLAVDFIGRECPR